MDLLLYARAQRIGGADGELVESLCDEIDKLREALLTCRESFLGAPMLFNVDTITERAKEIAELMAADESAAKDLFARTRREWRLRNDQAETLAMAVVRELDRFAGDDEAMTPNVEVTGAEPVLSAERPC